MSTKFPLVLNKNLGTLEELAPGDSLDLEGSSIIDAVDVSVTGNITANTITTLDLTATGTTRLGAVQNVVMTGGSGGQVITTDGNGNLSWATVAGVSGGNSISGNASYVTVFDDGVVGVGVDGVANTVLFEKELTTVGTDLTVVGNLDVQGTVTYIESTTITLEDNNITLANSAVDAAGANGAGFTVNGADAQITYISDTDTWDFNKTIKATVEGNVTGEVTGNATGISADGGTYQVSAYVAAVAEVLDGNGTVVTPAVPAVLAKSTIAVTDGANTVSWVFDSEGNLTLPGNVFSINFANGNPAVPDLGNIATIDLNGDATQYLNGNGEWATIDTSAINNGSSNVVVEQDANITISSNGIANIMDIGGETLTRYYTTTATANVGATDIVVDTVANLVVGQLIVSANIAPDNTTVASIDAPNLTVTLSAAITNAAPISTVFETYALRREVTVNGNLTVTGRATFGDIDHVNIGGGNANFVMKTDGSGNLSWTDANDLISLPVIPRMSFEAVANGSNQAFTNNNLTLYSDANAATVFRNGVLVDNTEYTINANAITFSVNLVEGENIDIIPVQSRIIETGATYTGTGTVTSIATAGSGLGFSLTGGTITQDGTVRLNVPSKANLKTTLAYGNVADLNLDGNVSNVLAGDGTFVALPVLPTYGNVANLNLDGNVSNVLNGNGQWVAMSGSNVDITGNIVPATDNTYTLGNATHRYAHIYVGPNSLTVGNVTISEASNAIVIDSLVANSFSGDGANITGVAYSEGSNTANVANIANVAYSVEFANVANIGNIANLDLDGNVSNVLTGNGTFVKLGNIAAIDLDGSTTKVMLGDGTFTANIPAPEGDGQILYSSGNVVTLSDLKFASNSTANTSEVRIGSYNANLSSGIGSSIEISNTSARVSVADIANTNYSNVSLTGILLTKGGNTANLTNNGLQFSNANANITAPGSNNQILFNSAGNIGNTTMLYSGNVLQVPGGRVFAAVNTQAPYSGVRYSSDTTGAGFALSKARGSRGSAATVQVGDDIAILNSAVYTGTGTTSADGISGWTPFAAFVTSTLSGLPATNAGLPSTSVKILTSNATSNLNQAVAVFDTNQQTTLNGNIIMNAGGANQATQYIPATATSTGVKGQIAYDTGFIYICTATNTWKRVAIATW